MRMVQAEGFAPATALTVSGGLTPSVTGQWIDVSRSNGNLSLILENSGASTSLTVTYQMGYIKRANESTNTKTAITPDTGGAITELTTVDINGSSIHDAITIDPTQYVRFVCANNSAAATATVSMYIIYQED